MAWIIKYFNWPLTKMIYETYETIMIFQNEYKIMIASSPLETIYANETTTSVPLTNRDVNDRGSFINDKK